MKKIVFPYDFSEASANAFSYALHLAEVMDASILTLHVYEPPTFNYVDYYNLMFENYNISEWEQLEDFRAHVPKLNAIVEKSGISGVEISHLLEQGTPADTICEVAKREKADYIIMGSIGATGLTEVFLGSVTEKTINDSPCDVLAVPGGFQYKKPSAMLYLTDLYDYRFRKLEKLLGFANLFDAHLDVLQVKSHMDIEDKGILKKWQKKFAGKDIGFHIHTGPTADEVVLNFAEAAKISLIAITTHHKSLVRRVFLYSLSQQLAFHTHVPILSLHTPSR